MVGKSSDARVVKAEIKTEIKADIKAEIVEVAIEQAGQRIDNFLIKYMKGVPKTRLYRALRGGEVRVNGARKKAPYQLCVGDKLRIPPIRRSANSTTHKRPPRIADTWLAKIPVLLEDRHLLVVDKPSGLAVHGGTGMDYGLIEVLRHLRPELPYLELAHRLDRETSGCLMLAKSRSVLLALQAQLGARSIGKTYTALLKGGWSGGSREVCIPLTKHKIAKYKPRTNEQKTTANEPRQEVRREARSIFSSEWSSAECTLVDIRLITGRMHQARIHAAGIAQPIAGDRLYGDPDFNRQMKRAGLQRLFLHARRLRFSHPDSGARVEICAPLPPALRKVLEYLRTNSSLPEST